jgi:hypothetical protein
MYSNQVRYFSNKNSIIIYKFLTSKFNFIINTQKSTQYTDYTIIFLYRKSCFSCDIIISTKRWQTLKALSVRTKGNDPKPVNAGCVNKTDFYNFGQDLYVHCMYLLLDSTEMSSYH